MLISVEFAMKSLDQTILLKKLLKMPADMALRSKMENVTVQVTFTVLLDQMVRLSHAAQKMVLRSTSGMILRFLVVIHFIVFPQIVKPVFNFKVHY